MPNLGEAAPRPYQCAEMIAANPDYGRIVCHCERVTRGEILDATRAPIPARTPRRAPPPHARAARAAARASSASPPSPTLLAEATGQPVSDLLNLDANEGSRE